MFVKKPVKNKRPPWKAKGIWAFMVAGMICFLYCLPVLAQYATEHQNSPVLQAYPCPTGIIEEAVKGLKDEYKGQSEVRISPDFRTSQILVYAPAAIQSRIAQRLEGIKREKITTDQRRGPVDLTPNQINISAPKSISIALQHIGGQQLEEALLRIMGNRLTATAPAELGAKSFHFILPTGAIVRLDILPQVNKASVYGSGPAAESFAHLIQALDTPVRSANESLQLISLKNSSLPAARRMVEAIQTAGGQGAVRNPMPTTLFQRPNKSPTLLAQANNNAQESGEAPPTANRNQQPEEEPSEEPLPEIGQLGQVQVEVLEGTDFLLLRGSRRDVEQLMKVIEEIEKLSAQTVPEIEVYKLKFIDSTALANLIQPIYEEVYLPRQGSVSITALVKPNALLVVGRKENVKTVLDLSQQLDQPVAPDTEFHVFRLRHATASSAQSMLTEFYADREGLGAKAKISADSRSNALIVQASPRDMAEIAAVINRIDTPTAEAVNEIKIIPLEHTLADDLATILQDAISAQVGEPTTRAQAGAQAGQAARATTSTSSEQRSAILRFLTIDTKGKRLLQSGILTDVRITPDTRTNALVVSAPAESMDLLEALIHELDRLPSAEASIKVFAIENGDASNLATMLQQLFGAMTQAGTTTAGRAALGTSAAASLQAVTLEGEASLVPVRLAVDVRTNCIIASGAQGDLNVIEAILLRLGQSEVPNRENYVFRLKNAPASDVATAINNYLNNIRSLQQQTPETTSTFEQIEQEAAVVAETVSNSLIVSATPKFFKEIQKIITELDKRPPMVMIQVLIAQVTLGDTEEFGVELGLQDGLLFDRSSAITDATTGNTLVPGFSFNNQSLGNSSDSLTSKPDNAAQTGAQGLSNFALGRNNSTLGYGGFVFSASSESISVLIRALKQNQRLEVLSRPQIMTLDNQQAFVMVGQQVPTIQNVSITSYGQTNSVTYTDVGLQLLVTPRISPDDIVAMAIDAVKSDLGPESEGIPISAVNGQIIRQPVINSTQAQTTVSAADGQTVVLGGLITKSKQDFHRKVPWVGDLPVIGRLFRYDGVTNERRELLIIMTPHVVRNEAQAEEIKKVEAARMNWCLSDVIETSGDTSLRTRDGDWSDKEIDVIYPDLNPRAIQQPGVDEKSLLLEPIPAPPALQNSAPNGSAPVKTPGLLDSPNQPNRENETAPQPESPQLPPTASAPDATPHPANKRAAVQVIGAGQVQTRSLQPLRGVQAASYPQMTGAAVRAGEVSAISATARDGANGVTTTVYETPTSYPQTQTPYYR
jgi:general secretion pathway protein D